jgi:hypothetical protein
VALYDDLGNVVHLAREEVLIEGAAKVRVVAPVVIAESDDVQLAAKVARKSPASAMRWTRPRTRSSKAATRCGRHDRSCLIWDADAWCADLLMQDGGLATDERARQFSSACFPTRARRTGLIAGSRRRSRRMVGRCLPLSDRRHGR